MSQLVTADAVLLDLRPARIPTRMLATAIDLLITVAIAFGLSQLTEAFAGSDALQNGLTIAGSIIFSFGYPTAMETLNRGRTVGAMALGLQAVRDDGGAIGFRQALIRALGFWLIDFAVWTGFCGGLVCAAINAQGKRIGDLLAQTMVIRTRAPRVPAANAELAPELLAWVREAELSTVPEELIAAGRYFVRRQTQFLDHPRQQLAFDLAGQLSRRISPPPPPGTSPTDFLTAVLGERRRRETERVRGPQASWVPSAEQLPQGWR